MTLRPNALSKRIARVDVVPWLWEEWGLGALGIGIRVHRVEQLQEGVKG